MAWGQLRPDSRYAPGRVPDQAPADDGYRWGLSDAADAQRRLETYRRVAFESSVTRLIDARFMVGNIDGSHYRDMWWRETSGLRRSLAADITRRYADPGVTVPQLDWLISWHAQQILAQWRGQRMRAGRDELRPSLGTRALAWLGGAGAALGLLCGLDGAFGDSARIGVTGLGLVAVGGLIIYWSKVDAYLLASVCPGSDGQHGRAVVIGR